MLIGELAHRTGVSTRSIRHYEDQKLLVPRRNANGYRQYDDSAVGVVEQIRTMIAAGLNTHTIQRYLDCARAGPSGTTLVLCPDLRAELDRIDARLEHQRIVIEATKSRLATLQEGHD